MIKKAILPVAGLGTRFLPASKAIPKEMVTVVDRPAIEYVVREAVEAGIEQIILVTHSSKASIENYFDRNFELETTLEQKKKFDLLKEITDILPKHVSVVSVRQPQPLGLGHAVLCAKDIVGNEAFAVLLPDVLVKNQSCDNDLSLMIQRFEQSQAAQIMALLENTPRGTGNEIQLTDAIATLQQSQNVEAYRMKGQTFDCGSKLGYLKAVLHYGIEHPKLGAEFKGLIQELAL